MLYIRIPAHRTGAMRNFAECCLEAAPIGKQIFAHGISQRDPTAFWLVLDTYATRLLAQALSLRFNYEGFCEGLYSIAKPFAFAQFVASGGRFDGRVALGPAGEPPSGSPRRPTAGFRRLRWRAHLRQKRRNYPVHPHGRKATRLVAPLPRQPKIRNTSPRQPQLGV